jgi:branched-chain amino acid transport system ATP-binding protein
LSSALLRVDGLVKHFGGLRAVDHASFDVAAGSITALIGPNGAGKTTLFDLVSGFIPEEGGTVQFDGRDITRAAPHEVGVAGLIRTFQQPRIMTRMTVRENLHLAARDHPGEYLGKLLFNRRGARRRETEVAERVEELLELVLLTRLGDDYAGTLSGGQRKLLEFARAVMPEPRMVLLDEPFAGVNPTLGRQLESLIVRLQSERRLTVLLIEHDLPAVMRISDRVVVMGDGRVIASGRPEQVRRDQAVIDAYLGTHSEGPGEGSS